MKKSLGAIAARYGTTVDGLLRLNPGVVPTTLAPGTQLPPAVGVHRRQPARQRNRQEDEGDDQPIERERAQAGHR